MATIMVDYENVSATNGLKGVEYLNVEETPKRLYVDSLHRFGRNDGTAIYRILK